MTTAPSTNRCRATMVLCVEVALFTDHRQGPLQAAANRGSEPEQVSPASDIRTASDESRLRYIQSLGSHRGFASASCTAVTRSNNPVSRYPSHDTEFYPLIALGILLTARTCSLTQQSDMIASTMAAPSSVIILLEPQYISWTEKWPCSAVSIRGQCRTG